MIQLENTLELISLGPWFILDPNKPIAWRVYSRRGKRGKKG